MTLADADGVRAVHADPEGCIELRVASGGLRIGTGADAFTIYEEGELACCGTAALIVASPGCVTEFAVLRGYVV